MKNEFDPQKPEWFELLDGDAPSAQVARVNKTIPILATVVTGVVLASGAVFAGTTERGNAESHVAVAATSTSPSPAATSAPAVQNQTAPTTSTSEKVAAPSSVSGKSSIQNPAVPGVQPPRGGEHDDDDEWGDDDDHDDDRWDDDHDDDDDDHERGEGKRHHEREDHNRD